VGPLKVSFAKETVMHQIVAQVSGSMVCMRINGLVC
jgi:hypothetical protein